MGKLKELQAEAEKANDDRDKAYKEHYVNTRVRELTNEELVKVFKDYEYKLETALSQAELRGRELGKCYARLYKATSELKGYKESFSRNPDWVSRKAHEEVKEELRLRKIEQLLITPSTQIAMQQAKAFTEVVENTNWLALTFGVAGFILGGVLL